jgi:hypothetical protein
MQRLLDGLVGGFDRKTEHCANAGSSRWTQMGDIIDFVLVQADTFDQRNLNFISGRKATNEIGARPCAMLGYR